MTAIYTDIGAKYVHLQITMTDDVNQQVMSSSHKQSNYASHIESLAIAMIYLSQNNLN